MTNLSPGLGRGLPQPPEQPRHLSLLHLPEGGAEGGRRQDEDVDVEHVGSEPLLPGRDGQQVSQVSQPCSPLPACLPARLCQRDGHDASQLSHPGQEHRQPLLQCQQGEHRPAQAG